MSIFFKSRWPWWCFYQGHWTKTKGFTSLSSAPPTSHSNIVQRALSQSGFCFGPKLVKQISHKINLMKYTMTVRTYGFKSATYECDLTQEPISSPFPQNVLYQAIFHASLNTVFSLLYADARTQQSPPLHIHHMLSTWMHVLCLKIMWFIFHSFIYSYVIHIIHFASSGQKKQKAMKPQWTLHAVSTLPFFLLSSLHHSFNHPQHIRRFVFAVWVN